MIHKKKGIFITATGTDVGKTYVTALILKKLREVSVNAGYYKAALSGAYRNAGELIPGDAAYVASISGLPVPPEQLVSTSMNLQFPPIWRQNWKNVQLT